MQSDAVTRHWKIRGAEASVPACENDFLCTISLSKHEETRCVHEEDKWRTHTISIIRTKAHPIFFHRMERTQRKRNESQDEGKKSSTTVETEYCSVNNHVCFNLNQKKSEQMESGVEQQKNVCYYFRFETVTVTCILISAIIFYAIHFFRSTSDQCCIWDMAK